MNVFADILHEGENLQDTENLQNLNYVYCTVACLIQTRKDANVVNVDFFAAMLKKFVCIVWNTHLIQRYNCLSLDCL